MRLNARGARVCAALMALCVPARAQTAADYAEARARVEAARSALAAEYRAARTDEELCFVREQARATLLAEITGHFFPAWEGTPWDFYGTSEKPREGFIACGYCVSTVLRDAGFRLERIRLAQQASARIVRTLAPATEVRELRDAPVADVVAAVTAMGDGLYAVGLDYHVGFLVAAGGRVQLCHASYLGPAHALCEPALESAAMVSRVHVVGKLLSDPMLDAWLKGRRIRTRTR